MGTELVDAPDWAQRLITERYPFLASDPEFRIDWELSMEGYLPFKSRGFYYTAIRHRWFVR